MKRVLLLLFTFSISLSLYSCEPWVDPHDMNSNPKQNLKLLQGRNFGDSKDAKQSQEVHQESCILEEKASISFVYLKRVVGLLLSSANYESTPGGHEGSIRIDVSKENYVFLKEFTKTEEVDADILRKLDAALSESFKKSLFDATALLSFTDYIYFNFGNTSTLLALLSVLTIIFCYKCYRQQSPVWYLAKYLFLVIYIIDFYIIYNDLIEEAENQKEVNNLHCDSWAEIGRAIFGNAKCKKVMVSPLQVFAKQMKTFIVVPLGYLGTGLGQFSGNIFGSLPWPFNILLFPISMLFGLFIIISIVSIATDTPLGFSFFHLFKFDIGRKYSSKNQDREYIVINQRVEDVKEENLSKRIRYRKPPVKKALEEKPKVTKEEVKSKKEEKKTVKVNEKKTKPEVSTKSTEPSVSEKSKND